MIFYILLEKEQTRIIYKNSANNNFLSERMPFDSIINYIIPL